MNVQVLQTKPRGDGKTEVTVYADGVRFTLVMEARVFGTDVGTRLLEVAAQRQVTEMARLREITAPGRREREA